MFNRDGLSSFFLFYILKNFKSFRIEVQGSTNRIFSSMLTIFLKIGQQLVPRTRRTFHRVYSSRFKFTFYVVTRMLQESNIKKEN